jgi:cell cycle arrest protein BUB2
MTDFALAVLTFCACTPPLSEVLHLFDFLLAYGCHMNILIVIAQLFALRDELIASKS